MSLIMELHVHVHYYSRALCVFINLSQLERTMISIEQHINHYLEGRCNLRVIMKQRLALLGGRGNHGSSATGQPPAPVTVRAQNNGRSPDDHRPKMPLDWSLFYLTGHFDRPHLYAFR